MGRIIVKQFDSLEDFAACERIQRAVWGDVGVSAEVLKVTRKYGGAVLGATVNGKIAGFIYAFLARRQGKMIHWSHLMAVEPGFRDLGLGFKMKLAHRQLALAAGVTAICWTFDPLQSRNAALNIGRLGARAEEFVPNCYGRFQSAIEKGLESDRFVVNWRIRSASVKRRLDGTRSEGRALTALMRLPRANETILNSAGFPENQRIRLSLNAARLLMEIPKETDRMRAEALKLAEQWRTESRTIFKRYFSLGYRAEDFIPPSEASGRRCFYILQK